MLPGMANPNPGIPLRKKSLLCQQVHFSTVPASMINGQLAHALGRKKARIHGMRSGKWGHRKPAGVPRVKKVGHAGVNRAWPDITSNVGRLLYTGFSCAQSLRRMNSLIFLRSYRCFCAFTGRSSALRNGCLSLLTISEMTSRDLIIGIILSRIEHSLINANAIKGQSGGVPPGWNEGRHEQVHVHCSDKMGTIPLQSSGYFYFATNSRGKVRSGRGWKTRVTRRKTLNECSLCFQGGEMERDYPEALRTRPIASRRESEC